jgi:hypothetical protein
MTIEKIAYIYCKDLAVLLELPVDTEVKSAQSGDEVWIEVSDDALKILTDYITAYELVGIIEHAVDTILFYNLRRKDEDDFVCAEWEEIE